MKAWVITQEGMQQDIEVVGILSARKSSKVAKEQVEWLHALLNYGPAEHVSLARYRAQQMPYEAEFMRTNTGVPVDDVMTCGHNPWLAARLAQKIVLIDADGEQPRLRWTEPDRKICDDANRIIETKPGPTLEARVRLPLLRTLSS